MILSNNLASPMLAMMLLTALVWVWMYVTRLSFMMRNRIDAEAFATPNQKAAIDMPSCVATPAANFSNLCELPVVFYAVCLLTMTQHVVTTSMVTMAWVFVGGRLLHSVIHCFYNAVMHRFTVYMLASFALWVLVIQVLLALIV